MNHLFPLKAPWRLRAERSARVKAVVDFIAAVCVILATGCALYMMMGF